MANHQESKVETTNTPTQLDKTTSQSDTALVPVLENLYRGTYEFLSLSSSSDVLIDNSNLDIDWPNYAFDDRSDFLILFQGPMALASDFLRNDSSFQYLI